MNSVPSHVKNYKNCLPFILNEKKPLKLYLLYLKVMQLQINYSESDLK